MVRCVRGPAISKSVFVELNVNEKVIVKDEETELVWQKEYKKDLDWKNALSYCENLEYAGFSDWRLPNINELKTLTNIEKSNPASDFPDISSDSFWSSTSHVVEDVNWARLVDFADGFVHGSEKVNENNARCVR